MYAKLIGHTAIDAGSMFDVGYNIHPGAETWADELAEFAGRNCYQSFHRPNPATADNGDYLDHILDVGHESVLEHASATFYIEASRSVLTELERHRHLSFSVVSQRYVDATTLGFNLPPALLDLEGDARNEALDLYLNVDDVTKAAYLQLVEIYTEAGKPRKQAREAARAVLPGMTNSPMVVTANHRAWRYVIKNRWHEAADAEIRQLAGELLRQLRELAPNTYSDIPETPYSYEKSAA
ncbi:FAD-dependent thymidylate synthase [Nocardia sp. IFM 10818]